MPKPHQLLRAAARPAVAAALFAAAFGARAGADLVPVSRIEPEFPREAISAGADAGKVRAKMTIDASGEVSRVEIIDANPRRVFDRAVVKTLSQWKFSPGSDGRSMEIDVNFHR
ncbi:MAG TPA: energy transducer TonB [Usitatibacter sp.]|jgi:protein TonB|nr:energy transducer TonB [Usitatibacter sp.]